MIWPFQKKTASNAQRVAVQLAGDQLHIVISGANTSAGTLEAPAGLPTAGELQNFVHSNGLEGAQTRVLLGFADYQMLLVEAPPVAEEELAEALKWKVKDLLSQPLEQSLVDGFMLPQDAFRGRQKMAYAVSTRRERLQALVDTLQDAGLVVESVTVGEVSLLPLFANLDEHPALVLVVGEGGGFLSMVANRAIYLVRKLDASRAELSAEGTRERAVERLVLEIQRSRDYFESQMGKGAINRLLLLHSSTEEALGELLGNQLGLPVEFFPVIDPGLEHVAEQQLLATVLSAA